jgi:glycosyltransferase involved in cell wall biosynthesis
MHVIALGHDNKISDPVSVPYARQKMYAQELESHTMIIANHGDCIHHRDGNLTVLTTGGGNGIKRAYRVWRLAVTQAKELSGTQVVVISQSPFELGFIAWCVARQFGFSLNIQLHGDFFGSAAWESEGIGNSVRRILGLFVLRRAQTIRVVSNRIKDSLVAKGLPPARIVVLPIQISVTSFLNAIPNPIWSGLVPPEAQVVVSVGRFAEEKNLPLLIKSFASVFAEVPTARLCLVGEGPKETMLRALVKELFPGGDAPVLFFPWQKNVAGVVKAAQVYALSSNYEGYAMVIPEAMACGVPVVTTDVGCVGEVFISGTHGLSVPVGDENAYMTALKTLLTDTQLRTQYGSQGKLTMEKMQNASALYPKQWLASLL